MAKILVIDDERSIRNTLSDILSLEGHKVDVAEDGEKVYVKVIDYKSGNQQFQLASLYYGLQLQLVVYMNAALELEAKKHPGKEVVPAALLYYHVEDPVVETEKKLKEEEVNELLRRKLRMNGVVNGDENIIEKLDKFLGEKSEVIPVEKKKDGTYSSHSDIMSGEDLKLISNYVNYKVKSIGREILAGYKDVNPYETSNKEACTYCAYKKVCGFDPLLPGYEKRVLEDLGEDEIVAKMKEVTE